MEVIGVNIYIDGVRHNASPLPLLVAGYNISNIKNPGDTFRVCFTYAYSDGTESGRTIEQTFTLLNEEINISVLNAWQGAVTDDGFIVAAKVLEQGNVRVNVYSDAAKTKLVVQSPETVADATLTVKLNVTGLEPGTQYYWAIESAGIVTSVGGRITTLPVGEASFKVVSSSCAGGNSYSSGRAYRISDHEVFDGIRTKHPDSLMFIHGGDLHYRDIGKSSPNPTYEAEFNQAYDDVLLTRQQDLYLNMPITFMPDDHDYGPNNSTSTSPSRAASLATYKSRVPHYPLALAGTNDCLAQTFVIGRVRFIILDTRSQRDIGTLLGAVQKQWLKDTLLAATEPVIGIQVGVPWLSSTNTDTWYGAAAERTELMDFFAANGLTSRLFLFAGDTHCIAIDSGINNAGIPVLQFASLDSAPSVKGGPYSEGSAAFIGQYGVLEFTDNRETITMKATGIHYLEGIEYPKVSYEKVFDAVPTSPSLLQLELVEGETVSSDLTIGFSIDSTQLLASMDSEYNHITNTEIKVKV